MKEFKTIAPIVALLLLTTSQHVISTETGSVTEISFGAVKTELEKSAVAYVIKHSPKDDIYVADKTSFIDMSPIIEIQTGGDDSFNGLVAKLQGHKVLTKSIDDPRLGSITCAECSFHVIPFAIGMETDANMENISLLGEIGYFPVGRQNSEGKPRFGLSGPRIGFFLQAGYKFNNKEGSVGSGGADDESSEEPDSNLARAKVDIRGKFGGKTNFFNLIPNVRGWYDFINSETYYKAEAIVRLNITNDKSFDLKYEKGSGAPNFNKGEQFTAGLTMTF